MQEQKLTSMRVNRDDASSFTGASNALAIPQLELPKAGGALKGIDEKFTANPSSGTASLSVPLPITAGRNNFQPALALSYDSGNGNSAFGLGWDIAYPCIQRRTDKGVPRYNDSDTFMYTGAEELVPFIHADGTPEEQVSGEYHIKRFRPRIEKQFHRIEMITHTGTPGFYWKLTTVDNIVTIFGRSDTHRLANPADPTHVFKWLPELSFDDKGNLMVYEFKPEDLAAVPALLHEKNHLNANSPFANSYLKRVLYGNLTPFYPDYSVPENLYYARVPPGVEFLLELVVDYGEHTDDSNTGNATWLSRTDPFSGFRAVFEIRTWRLCQRILMFHHFTNREFGFAENEDRVAYLVKSLDLHYTVTELSLLTSVTQTSYKKNGAVLAKKSLPSLDFNYQELHWDTSIRDIDGFERFSGYQFTDLFNEGLPGILIEKESAWYYKCNTGSAIFSEPIVVGSKPNEPTAMASLRDLDGDGSKQLVTETGYYELNSDDQWEIFKNFDQLAIFNKQDKNSRLVGLQGNGRTDILVATDNTFSRWPSLGRQGYDSRETIVMDLDEEKNPAIVFRDENQTIFMADMNGDGLADIIRIRNGEIAYWPNCGYGRFSAKITMDNAPWFDEPGQFNTEYIHLADISGTGATDIIYLGKNRFSAWLNRSGNSWSDECTLNSFPPTALPARIEVTDLMGNGTGSIVWSSPLPAVNDGCMKYIDLMGGKKPHIMTGYKTNMGKTVSFSYKSSTVFYLADKKNGQPWLTKLPFPIQCLAGTTTTDEVTGMSFSNSYSYHHGYYDHAEKEFRGFGRVEQTDTINTDDGEVDEAPLLTKTWFHTGIATSFDGEYFPMGENLPAAELPAGLSPEEFREAHHACKGMLLRQEIYSLDNPEKQSLPLSVAAHNCLVRKLQDAKNAHASFIVAESETLQITLERNPADPRISHTLNLEFDDLGKLLKSVSVVYPRKSRPAELTDDRVWTEQDKTHITVSENSLTADLISAAAYRLRMPFEIKQSELRGISPSGSSGLFVKSDFAITPQLIPFETAFTPNLLQQRLMRHDRKIYLSDDLLSPLAPGIHGQLGLHHQSYRLAFTPGLLNEIYKNPDNSSKLDAVVLARAKYIDPDGDGNLWISSGTAGYITDAASRFYTPSFYTDAFDTRTNVFYYSNYFMMLEKTEDARENKKVVENFDFRTLCPVRMRDMNNNRTEVALDIFGNPAGSAVLGKGTEADDLVGFIPDLTDSDIAAFLTDPIANGRNLLQHASSRVICDYTRIPCVSAEIRREEFFAKNGNAALGYSFSYTDGLGSISLAKVQTTPGPSGQGRWIGNGRTVLNNKGKPVKQYQPYFSDTHIWENEGAIRDTGVSSVLHYDSSGRLVRTDMPDDTFSKTIYDAWKQLSYDANDTVLESKWYSDRITNSLDAVFMAGNRDPQQEKIAAQKTAVHASTPLLTHLDCQGRSICTVGHNKRTDFSINTVVEEFYSLFSQLDIEGNPLALIDTFGNTIVGYRYDMAGNKIYLDNMDSGRRWLFNNCMGKPLFLWDTRDQRLENVYDELHRIMSIKLKTANGEKTVSVQQYADTTGLSAADLATGQSANRIGKSIRQYDSSGLTSLVKADLNGNILASTKQFCKGYQTGPDWSSLTTVELESDIYVSETEYDALNRPVSTTLPASGTQPAVKIRHGYNESGLTATIAASLIATGPFSNFVNRIDYNARGMREAVYYNNGTVTRYSYDPVNFRLLRVLTTSSAGTNSLQDLRYTYDPVGNITYKKDFSQSTVFFNNQAVNPENSYDYDAIYRLVRASGREHRGQSNINETASQSNNNGVDHRNFPFEDGAGAADNTAFRNYVQQFFYDGANNLLRLEHKGDGNNWIRKYWYNNADAGRAELGIDPAEKKNNRLLQTQLGSATPYRYNYDEHGNILALPQFTDGQWNFRDQLQSVGLGGGGIAFYVYDDSGHRVRKIIEKTDGTRDERLYLMGLEIYREFSASGQPTKQVDSIHIQDEMGRMALIDTPVITQTNEQQVIRYIYSDVQGSSMLELNENAIPVSYEEYHPYGTTSYSLSGSPVRAAAKRYRYTAMERDEETGLAYHSARYYMPWLGRWLSADPSGVTGGLNSYNYASSNPVRYTDITGNDPGGPSGTFRFPFKDPVSDTGSQAAFFDILPALWGWTLEDADLSDNWLYRTLEVSSTTLLIWGPIVYWHELGHVGAARRFGDTAAVTEFGWWSGLTSRGLKVDFSHDQDVIFSAAGVNEQTLYAEHVYSRWAMSSSITLTEYTAYLLGLGGLPGYAGRTVILDIHKGKDDLNFYGNNNPWSVKSIFQGSMATMAVPLGFGLFQAGWYAWGGRKNSRIRLPRLHVGSLDITFPHTQLLLTTKGPLFGLRTFVNPEGNLPVEVNADYRPDDHAVDVGVKVHGIKIPGVPRLSLSPSLTARFGGGTLGGQVGLDIEYNFTNNLGLTFSGGYRKNDLRAQPEGKTDGFDFHFGLKLMLGN